MPNNFTSRHQIGDDVVVNFGCAGIISGVIEAVIFKETQVFYNIKVYPFSDEEENKNLTILLKEIRSYYVEKGYDRFKEELGDGWNGASCVGLKQSLN